MWFIIGLSSTRECESFKSGRKTGIVPYSEFTILPAQGFPKGLSLQNPCINVPNLSIVWTGLRNKDKPSLTSNMPKPAFAATKRSRVVWMLFKLMSTWMNLRPKRLETAAVTPLPPKKSATTIPSLLLAFIIRSNNASGFCVAYAWCSLLKVNTEETFQTSSICDILYSPYSSLPSLGPFIASFLLGPYIWT